ncbi:hypothetical protein GH714_031277 [Hevea brasiliensis]|uniref:Uncharacterized protein n=1 Tax=Hevea brasiliensis TaxID=3981 RepID=A0A6A6NL59_HEVBR|nr:hypothetical protein GH714_031277 [Hevea brasiliensis]
MESQRNKEPPLCANGLWLLWNKYLKLNPLGYVSVLVVGETVVFDSFAILMVANIVSSTIQPLQNQPMLNFVEDKVGPDEKLAWAQYYIGKGFAEFLLPRLFVQTQFPLLLRLYAAYNEIPSFHNAMPEKQPATNKSIVDYEVKGTKKNSRSIMSNM